MEGSCLNTDMNPGGASPFPGQPGVYFVAFHTVYYHGGERREHPLNAVVTLPEVTLPQNLTNALENLALTFAPYKADVTLLNFVYLGQEGPPEQPPETSPETDTET